MANEIIVRMARVLAVVVIAIAVGLAATMAAAMLGHQFLVLRVGEDGISAIDDTPLMFAMVAAAYLAGGLSGLAVLVLGWWRFLRRRA